MCRLGEGSNECVEEEGVVVRGSLVIGEDEGGSIVNGVEE